MDGATLLFKRGNEANLPPLQTGEPAFTIDSGRLYVGSSVGNVQIGASDLSASVPGWYFDEDAAASNFRTGHLYWNKVEGTLNIDTALSGVSIQVGQEMMFRIFNDTGETLGNGDVVCISGTSADYPTVFKAISNAASTVTGVLGLVTASAVNGSKTYVTTAGKVRGLNTSSFSAGTILYISPDTAGSLVATRPSHPNYVVQVGTVLVSAPTSGVVLVDTVGRPHDIIENFFNGTFVESFDFRITASSSASTITGTLERTGGGDLTMQFSDGFTLLDTSPAASVALTAGSETNPQLNYIYVLQASKIIQNSTTSWPSGEHIKIASVALRTAATTENYGALRNQNWNDHLASSTEQGHLSEIGERFRQEPARWNSGTEATVTIDTVPSPDSVVIAVTSGDVYQMHKQTFPALDMGTGDVIHVVNHPTNPYVTVTDLNTQILDSAGTTLNNKYFSFVVFGVQNKTGETSHLMMNLPTGSYNTSADAVADAENKSVYDIPDIFKGVGFLIARFTFYYQGGANWTLESTDDLRGKVPDSTAGGGGGGGGTTTFTGLTDTPSTYTGYATQVPIVNAAENALEWGQAFHGGSIASALGVGVSPGSSIHTASGLWVAGSTQLFGKTGIGGPPAPIGNTEILVVTGATCMNGSLTLVNGTFNIPEITGTGIGASGLFVKPGNSVAGSGSMVLYGNDSDAVLSIGQSEVLSPRYTFHTAGKFLESFSALSPITFSSTIIALSSIEVANNANFASNVIITSDLTVTQNATVAQNASVLNQLHVSSGIHSASTTYLMGNVGIGTLNPALGFEVVSAAANTRFTATSSGGLGINQYYQPDTTDGNKLVLNFLTDTTGAGATAETFLGQFRFEYTTHNHATRAGEFSFTTLQGGAFGTRLTIGAGIQVGSPTGGDKGLGWVNVASGIAKNDNTYANPDYVLSKYFCGTLGKFKDNPGARLYDKLVPLDDLEGFMREHLHLPNRWESTDIFEWADMAQMWSEELAIYITQLHNRVKKLESVISNKQ